MPLECHHIHYQYPGTDRILFQDLNLNLGAPGFHALFGPSGVGKSSLARMLIGRLRADQGTIATNGLGVALYAHNLERLPGWSSVGRHIERVTPAHNVAKREALIKAFGLTAFLRQRFAQLSLGQQNRVNLVRYLVQEFGLLIMDESLANVDEKLRGRIVLTIKEMFPEVYFIYISHNVVEVATYCQSIWVLRGAHKAPQAVMVQGQDQKLGKGVDQAALQGTMLEIMNAA